MHEIQSIDTKHVGMYTQLHCYFLKTTFFDGFEFFLIVK